MTRETDAKLLYKEKSYLIQGGAFEVYKQFRNRYKETVYQRALVEYLKNNWFRVGFALLFSVSLALPLVGQAVELNLTSQSQEIKSGGQFEAGFFLNTENEYINAIEGKIIFPADLLELKEIRDGNSIVNFWIERPKTTGNQIIFSGIIPGGYQETKGFVFSVVFRAKTEGQGAIEIRDAKVLLNDGEGTPASVKLSSFQFSISQEVPPALPMVETLKDTDPPEEFKPEIAQSPEIFEGKYFLVFVTQDKGSGIAYYAIRETRREINLKRETDAKWEVAESPYVLKDQNLRSYIYVKAVDKAGNERIKMVLAKYPLKWYENWWIWGIIIIIGVVFAYITRKILWRK